MTLTRVNEYKVISKDFVHPQIVMSASGRYGMPKTRQQLLVSLLLTPSTFSFLAHELE
jgi:hypothetical protein